MTIDGILIIVVPLNLLGRQNIDQLNKVGISGIVITGENGTVYNFEAIRKGKFRVVITNPEMLMKAGKIGFASLFSDSDFTSRVISLVFDEAHCLPGWGDFRGEFREVGRLRHILHGVPMLFTSATMPEYVRSDLLKIVHIPQDKLHVVHRSNDRPNVFISVREMKHSIKSYKDLNFLVEGWADGKTKPRKFLVLFDSIRECVEAIRHLRSLLPYRLRDRIKWHNSHMSTEFKEQTVQAFLEGNLDALGGTDTLGMGMDIPDFEIVAQYRVHKLNMCSLLQRLGRGARDPTRKAVFLLLVEPKFFLRNKKPEKTGKKKPPGNTASVPRSKRSRGSKNPPPPQLCSEIAPEESPDEEPSDVMQTVMSFDEFVESRRLAYILYQRNLTTNGLNNSKRFEPMGPDDLDPALSDIINADYIGLCCRRIPITLVFKNNDLPTDHLDCRVGGCTRCRPCSSELCCDLHSPAELQSLCKPIPITDPPITMSFQAALSLDQGSTLDQHQGSATSGAAVEPNTQAAGSSGTQHSETTAMEDLVKGGKKGKSKLAKYEAGPSDDALYMALLSWRHGCVKTMYGFGAFVNIGTGSVLPDALLDRIVDCAHWGKIGSLEDLRRETGWADVTDYGPEVLNIIAEHQPHFSNSTSDDVAILGNNTRASNEDIGATAVCGTASNEPRGSQPSAQQRQKKRKKTNGDEDKENGRPAKATRRCSNCSQPGHNCRKCPNRQENSGQTQFIVGRPL